MGLYVNRNFVGWGDQSTRWRAMILVQWNMAS